MENMKRKSESEQEAGSSKRRRESSSGSIRLNTHSCYICGVEKTQKLSYFSFPKDKVRRIDWMSRFNIDLTTNVSNLRLCGNHFITEGRKIVGFKDATGTESSSNYDQNSDHKRIHLRCIICSRGRGKKLGHTSENSVQSFFKVRPNWDSIPGLKELVDSDKCKDHRICSRHFRAEDFNHSLQFGGRFRLNKDAVPSLFLKDVLDEENSAPVDKSNNVVQVFSQPSTSEIHTNVHNSSTSSIEHVAVCDQQSTPEALTNVVDVDPSTPTRIMETDVSCDEIHCSIDTTSTNDTQCSLDAGLSTPTSIRKTPRYPGDIHTPDFETPRRRESSVRVLRQFINKQAKQIRILQQQLRRANMKISNLEGIINDLRMRKMVSEQLKDHILKELPPIISHLALRKLTNQRKKYQPELRKFALTLRFYSPKAYEYVREKWGKLLPHPGTLRRWCCSMNLQAGFNEEVLQFLNKRQELEHGRPMLCNLVMDEMSIRQKLTLRNGRQYGCVDLGIPIETKETSETDEDLENEEPEAESLRPLAKSAMVFLLVSLNNDCKVPFGYFFKDSLNGEEKANLVLEALKQLENRKVAVRSLTFDGVQSNFTMARKLGANFDLKDPEKFKPYFPHPVSKEHVYLFPDPCHMLKNIRNMFATTVKRRKKTGELVSTARFYDSNKNEISWSYIEKIADLHAAEGLRGGKCKIGSRHIHFEDNKMNVRLAAQTLSESTASLLTYLISDKPDKFKNAAGTSKFCKMYNDAFDMLNSRSCEKFENEYGRPICKTFYKKLERRSEEVIQYTMELKNHLGEKIIDGKKKCGFLGIIICLKNMFSLYNDLKKNYGLKFLLTYKILQDHLENFFSCIRMRGGFNNNPSAHQFYCSYRQLVIHHEIRASESANCGSLDSEIPVLTITNLHLENEENDMEYEINSKNRFNFEGVTVTSQFVDDVVDYIGGFVIRKMEKKFSDACPSCIAALVDAEKKSNLIDAFSKGHLKKPSKDLHSLLRRIEIIIRDNDTKIFHKNFVSAVIENMEKTMNEIFICGEDEHRRNILTFIMFYYMKIRLFHESELVAEIDRRIRRVYTKLIHYKNE